MEGWSLVMDAGVVALLQHLIRFDTTNFGHGRSHGETPCAQWIAGLLQGAGYAPVVLHRPDAPDRASVLVRVEGSDAGLPGLLVHGHLDVVPANAAEWSVDPFGGEVVDGYVYGRGAVDMKDMVACMLSTLLRWARKGVRPRRRMVFAFLADEEANSRYGAGWLVTEHPELFAGCVAAVGEEGGQVLPTPTASGGVARLYPIAVAERGTLHCRLVARGNPGHGSRPTGRDAVARLLVALHRIQGHAWPWRVSDAVRAQVASMSQALGHPVDVDDPASFRAFCRAIGREAAGPLPWTVRSSATVTILQAGNKVNVIPSAALAELDVRCPPGAFEETRRTILELAGPDVDVEFLAHGHPCEAPIDSPWFRAMAAVVAEFDPQGVVVPFCMGGGTDAKAFAKLGMHCYGFTPLGADPAGRRPGGIHGIDERNTVKGLKIGNRMLRRFLETV